MGEVVAEVASHTEGNAIIVTDVGQHQMSSARYSIYNAITLIHHQWRARNHGVRTTGGNRGQSSSTRTSSNLLLGDGGFQMTMQELGTMLHWKIDVKIIILNNSFWGMVRQWQDLFFQKYHALTAMVNPDFVQIAEAYAIPARRITQRPELTEAIQQMLQASGSYLLEVVVDKEYDVFPMVPVGAIISDPIFKKHDKSI